MQWSGPGYGNYWLCLLFYSGWMKKRGCIWKFPNTFCPLFTFQGSRNARNSSVCWNWSGYNLFQRNNAEKGHSRYLKARVFKFNSRYFSLLRFIPVLSCLPSVAQCSRIKNFVSRHFFSLKLANTFKFTLLIVETIKNLLPTWKTLKIWKIQNSVKSRFELVFLRFWDLDRSIR
jgi:hypothetical protein